MKPSLLQLDHYAFSEIHLQHIPSSEVQYVNGYPSMDAAKFGSQVEFSLVESSEAPNGGIQRFGVRLIVEGEPKDADKPGFPYKFRFDAMGIFHGPDLPEAKRESMVIVNGASILYGAIREQLLTLTSRSTGPALMLPTVRFDQIAAEHEARKSERPES